MYGLYSEHPKRYAADIELTNIMDKFIEEFKEWQTKYSEVGAMDTAAEEVIANVLTERLF